MQMRNSVMLAALDAKYTKELADAKAENDALRDDVAAGRRRVAHYRQPVSQCEATTSPPAWIMQPPPTGRQLLNGIISPLRERADHYVKQLEGTQKHINEQCR